MSAMERGLLEKQEGAIAGRNDWELRTQRRCAAKLEHEHAGSGWA